MIAIFAFYVPNVGWAGLTSGVGGQSMGSLFMHVLFMVVIVLMLRATVRSFRASRVPKDDMDAVSQS